MLYLCVACKYCGWDLPLYESLRSLRTHSHTSEHSSLALVPAKPVLTPAFSIGPREHCPEEPFSTGWSLQPVLKCATDAGEQRLVPL
jgi:hypothetical protein